MEHFTEENSMKLFGFTTIITFGVIFFFLTSCSEQKQTAEKPQPEKARVESLSTTSADIKKEAEDLAKTTMAYTEEQKALYQEKIQEKMEQYSQKLMELQAKMVMLNEQAKASLAVEIENLNRKKQEVAEKTGEIQTASGEAYEDLKKGLDQSLENMEKALDEAISRFEK